MSRESGLLKEKTNEQTNKQTKNKTKQKQKQTTNKNKNNNNNNSRGYRHVIEVSTDRCNAMTISVFCVQITSTWRIEYNRNFINVSMPYSLGKSHTILGRQMDVA